MKIKPPQDVLDVLNEGIKDAGSRERDARAEKARLTRTKDILTGKRRGPGRPPGSRNGKAAKA